MAITRSQIARQLLAEGGAPRIPFRSGGREDANTMSGSGYGAGSSSSNDGYGGGDDVARQTYAEQYKTENPMMQPGTTGETFPGLSKVTPRDVFRTSADNPMLQRSLFERAMIQMIPGFGGAINLGEMNAFNLPQFRYSNTGGIDDRFNTTDDDDNNQIVRPMMPMVPKLPTDIEPEKSDYAEFVQRFSLPERFRLSAGGSPGNTTSQRVLPRADGRRPGYYGSDAGFGDDDYKDESASFDAGSGSGGSDADFAAARDAIMGPSTYTDDRGNTIDVSGLQKQGYGRLGIADLLGPLGQQYGIGVNTPSIDVLGPLGNIGADKDKDKDEGAKDNLDDLRQSALDIGRSISNPGSLFGQALTAGQAAVAKEQSLRDRFDIGRADGGPIRQAYGLGSIVKKVTGAVKKVVKSDVGKAALLAATAYYAPGIGIKAQGGFAPFLQGAKSGLGNFFLGAADPVGTGRLGFGTSTLGKFLGTGQGKIAAGILGTSLAAGLLTPKQEEEADSLSKRIADRTGLDIAGIRKEVQDAYANNNVGSLKNKYPFLITQSAAAAEGGRIGYDMGGISGMMASNMENDKILENLFEKYLDMGLSPEDAAKKAREEFDRMSKAEEPDRMMAAVGGMMNPNDEMLNLGGNEMDLRGGGFVPLGEYEKKDDVPARLSKNEFVFTADAVKAAGGGSVDRGADLMYKTMKQLENKVA
jgi:hypothetical protein